MKKLHVMAAAALALAATSARAQEAQPRFSLAPIVGAYVATGDQRDVLDDAFLAGLALSFDVHRYVSLVGAFSWAATQEKLGGEDIDLLQYDLGVQGQYPVALAAGWTLKPFLGVGAGARTYTFRDSTGDAETDFAGYLSAGANLEHGRLMLGLTVRNYLTAFDGLDGEADSATHDDLSMFGSVGVRF